MKTLQQHTLIYDRDCPMCRMYSDGFIKTKMLDQNGRLAFSEITEQQKDLIDFQRAKNEIALVDTQNKKVIYGLESLLVIIGHSFPFATKFARLNPFYWVLQRLYKFISYNRKQIIPSKNDLEINSCVPSFNLKYRILYIVFVYFFSAIVLAYYNAKLFPEFTNHFELKFFICLMQIVWQTVFLGAFLKDKFWDYLGNMMTVSLIGTFLLLPTLFFNFSQIFYFVYFGIVIFIMFWEHFRRCSILKLGILPTISWLIFRITFGGLLLLIVSYY